MLAIVCPGQGSQTSGFLRPWLELPDAERSLRDLSAAAGLDLVAHGTTSDDDTIRDTAIAQPLIVGAGLLTLGLLADRLGGATVRADVVTGHSVGEVTAAAVAGVLPADAAMRLVRTRGLAMASASAASPTGMSAVLGGRPDDVAAALARHGLTAANHNGAGQVVAAGTREQLDALHAEPPARARVVALQVAGAFHTHHMTPAVDSLATHAGTVDAADAHSPVVSNRDGALIRHGDEVLERLVSQVSSPVRWDLCMETLTRLGVTGILELAPAGTLVGLARRGMPGVEAVALRTPDDLDDARRLVREHTTGADGADGADGTTGADGAAGTPGQESAA